CGSSVTVNHKRASPFGTRSWTCGTGNHKHTKSILRGPLGQGDIGIEDNGRLMSIEVGSEAALRYDRPMLPSDADLDHFRTVGDPLADALVERLERLERGYPNEPIATIERLA